MMPPDAAVLVECFEFVFGVVVGIAEVFDEVFTVFSLDDVGEALGGTVLTGTAVEESPVGLSATTDVELEGSKPVKGGTRKEAVFEAVLVGFGVAFARNTVSKNAVIFAIAPLIRAALSEGERDSVDTEPEFSTLELGRLLGLSVLAPWIFDLVTLFNGTGAEGLTSEDDFRTAVFLVAL